jgi:hypothetical protein
MNRFGNCLSLRQVHRICRAASVLVLGWSSICAASDSVSVIPLRLIGTSPIVIAKIEGKDVPLAFDLGDSSPLVLQQRFIDQVTTLPSKESHRGTDVQGNIIESETFIVPRLQLGTVVFTDVVGRPDKHDPAYPGGANRAQGGQFGTSLLKSYKVLLDYPHREMTLIPANSPDAQAAKCKGTVVPFLADWNGDPVTSARTDAGEVTVVWDTGSPVSILRQARAQNIGASVLAQHVTTKRLILGDTDFGPLRLDVADYAEPAGTDMFIGYNFFAKHVVCIDFPGQRFLIQR